MKNNMLGKIAFALSNVGKSKLDFTHDVSTTAAFGDVQPTTCKLILPNSNGQVQSHSLVRFGAMVAPTFGRIKAKEYHTLVPMSDLLENFAFMLAQGRKANGLNVGAQIIAPQDVPHMTLGLLSRMCLIGAEIEIYPHRTNDEGLTTQIMQAETTAVAHDFADVSTTVRSWIRTDYTATGNLVPYKGSMFNIGALTWDWAYSNNILADEAENKDFWIPIKNKTVASCFGVKTEKYVAEDGNVYDIEKIEHLPLDKSSLAITFEAPNDAASVYPCYTIVFRLSSFGKRIRKMIIGAHKQINLTSTEPVEVISLFAIWKAWFDLFGLTLYDNYEVTPLRKLTKWCDNQSVTNLDPYWNKFLWTDFVLALGRMWYTDAQDAVSAHVTSTAISPSLGLGDSFIDVDGTGANVTEVNNPNGNQGQNGHAFINAIRHGQLDAEYLQKLYVWCNKNTIAGKEIEKVLRAQGLGKFCDSCKSNFIGYHEEMMQVFDVVSTADTFKDGQGSLLGEYGGRGIKQYNSGKKSFSTDEFCFQVSLFTIVPEAGYLQAIDPTSYCIKKTDFLLGEFDALGMEATRKTIVCGAQNWSSQCEGDGYGSMDDNFGLIPRGTHLKLAHNIANGDITLRDTRDAYLPYTCDKFIDVGERFVSADSGTRYGIKYLNVVRELAPKDVPHASLHYRYPCRYPWFGNFDRIFAYQGEAFDAELYEAMASDPEAFTARWEFLNNEYGNFIVHEIIELPVWSPCKAIEQSFETYAEGEKPNAKMEKA